TGAWGQLRAPGCCWGGGLGWAARLAGPVSGGGRALQRGSDGAGGVLAVGRRGQRTAAECLVAAVEELDRPLASETQERQAAGLALTNGLFTRQRRGAGAAFPVIRR